MIAMALIRTFLRDETGSSAIEYGLIAGFVACVLISAVQSLGSNLNSKFSRIVTKIGS